MYRNCACTAFSFSNKPIAYALCFLASILLFSEVLSCRAQQTIDMLGQFPIAPEVQVTTASIKGPTPTISFAAYLASTRVATKPPSAQRKTVDKELILMNGLNLGMTGLDYEMTEHCITDRRCVEGNPFMPDSHAGKIAIGGGFVVYGVIGSYWLKKHHRRSWWIVPAVGIATHTVGVASGFRNY